MTLTENDSFKPRPVNVVAIEKLLQFCDIRDYEKKHVVIKPNEPADKLYYILEGSVSVVSPDEGGSEVILAYLNVGEFIGEIGIFFQSNKRNVTVRARTDCKLAYIAYSSLEKLFQNELAQQKAEILFAVGLQLSQRLLKTSRKVTHLATLDVAGRIARTLMDMCSEPDAMSHPDGTQIHISRQDLGRLVGCSREVAGRVLKKMAIDGAIEINGMDIVVFHER